MTATLRRLRAMVVPLAGLLAAAGAALAAPQSPGPDSGSRFRWPDGKRAALSLSFDDARESQLSAGLPLFAERGIRVTFYLSAADIGDRALRWRQAAAAGHEMGNHSMSHPCSGNFAWARQKALEDYTLDRMRGEMTTASRSIEDATGVRPLTFAYPCGQTFVGRGASTASYVPLASELFVAARGWQGETANDPGFVDLAQLLGYPMDDREYSGLQPVVEETIARGGWLVLAGHDIGTGPGPQVTRVSMLRDLLADVTRPDRGVWVDTVANVAGHVRAARGDAR